MRICKSILVSLLTIIALAAQSAVPNTLSTGQLRYLRFVLLTIGDESTSNAKGLASFEQRLVVELQLTAQDLANIRYAAQIIGKIPATWSKSQREEVIAEEAAYVMTSVTASTANRVRQHCAVIQQLESKRTGGNAQ